MLREGYIEKIIYRNEENGYTVLEVETTEGNEVFHGTVFGAAEGMYVRAEGEYVYHPQYDLQFRMDTCELSMPEDLTGIERFLASGVIKGVRETMARRILQTFREDSLRIMDEEPERLAEIKGISLKMARKMGESYQETRAYRNVIMFLSKYGIGVKMAVKIYREFGDGIYKVIKENPYRIAEAVPGVGFVTADRIALGSGMARDSSIRLHSLVLYILGESGNLGHMYIPESWLVKKAYELSESEEEFGEFQERIHDLLLEMTIAGKVMMKNTPDGEVAVYAAWDYYTELGSARLLNDLTLHYDIDESELETAMKRVEKECGIQMEEIQKNAVETAIRSGVSVITGGPGTGKTTIIHAIIKYFEQQGESVLLAAPTGRAAKRITESTGYQARTIHRLLEFCGMPENNGEDVKMTFLRNEENPLSCDALIVDEASMIDSRLFYALLKALVNGTRLILVGDTDQLPPVGAGNVLHDIIASGCFPVTVLQRIFRQAEDSSIVENAHRIKDGIHLSINNKSKDFFFIPRSGTEAIREECVKLLRDQLPGYLGVEPGEIQLLTPMRRYELGVEAMNRTLQSAINPPGRTKREKAFGEVIFREGDKVMQIRNDYKLEWKIYRNVPKREGLLDEGIGVFNGDMGTLVEVNDFDEELVVLFDDGRIVTYDYRQADNLSHAFAITVHKSQGSEYPAVVLPLYSGPRKLLSRNLLYTAVTRARQMVVVVGNLKLVNDMIDNVQVQRRFTGFTERIKEIYADTD